MSEKNFNSFTPQRQPTESMTPEKAFAIQLVHEIGDQLAIEHPEIAELYKNPFLRLIDIARQVFPKEYIDQFPEVYTKAVGWAIRQLNPAEEQADLTRQHRQATAETNFGLDTPDFIRQCKEAAKRRHEMHGVDTEAMIRGRGR
ncbi:MAG: hypothetical protein ACD_18C00240G0001 [uncultured bacterium]|nr:MAG: hypothetical protein ACD_18C00240G0001 [uncultured bacterium]